MLNKKTLSVATAMLLLNIFNNNLNSAPFKPVLSAEDSSVPNVKADPRVKIGNEYEIFGVKYKPKAVDSYDVIGIASWYGEAFHGKLTANGEVYDMNLLTAASPDLPLPAFVEVTNLDNGKKIIVRVNDRGPFSGGRVLDLSKRSAELLGFQNQGTARVRVTLLKNITDQAVKDLQIEMLKRDQEEAKAQNATNTQLKSENVEPVVKEASDAVEAKNNLNAFPPIKVPNSAPTPANVVKIIPTTTVKESSENEILSASDDAKMQNINLADPNPVKSYVPRGVFVQIGAFNANNASVEKKVGNLSQIGVVSLQKIDIEGKDVLRLRVGPYGSVDDAIVIKNRLVKLGYQDSRVVVEE